MPKHPLEKLLLEHCPQGVEFVELGEVTRRVANVAWKNNPKNYRYIDLSSVDRELSQITQTTPINAQNAPSRARYIVETKDVLLGTTRPLLKRITLVGAEHNGQICSTGFCVLRADIVKVLPEWIFYNITSDRFFMHARAWQEGTSYPMLADKHVMSFTIPLPPLIVQEKIVAILDCFAELTAELTARKKQYSYYLNALLDFGVAAGGGGVTLEPYRFTHAVVNKSFTVEWVAGGGG
ncbi:restriction endonuclease subunit S, partial [Helicobacter felis]|uniref:restriction endonuclease subunit S n=2 Tax=Helicobacter felis TaxID=214 RepID=UPI0018F83DD9